MTNYSPDLNPIEEAFAKINHILRKIGAHTRDALIVYERSTDRRVMLVKSRQQRCKELS